MDEPLPGPALDLARLPSTREIVPILEPTGDIQPLLDTGVSLQHAATQYGTCWNFLSAARRSPYDGRNPGEMGWSR